MLRYAHPCSDHHPWTQALENILQLTSFMLALTMLFLSRELQWLPYRLDPFNEHWVDRLQCRACRPGENVTNFAQSVDVKGAAFVCPDSVSLMDELCRWGNEEIDSMGNFKIGLTLLVTCVVLRPPPS